MAAELHLDYAALGAVLRSPAVAGLVRAQAEAVRANLAAAGLLAEVETYTTDRPVAAVTVRSPRARGLQVRDGVVTSAASAAGLEVRR
jgi:hypothetical protein